MSGNETTADPEIYVIVGDGGDDDDDDDQHPSGLPITFTVSNNTSGTATIYSDGVVPWDYNINGTVGSQTITIPAYTGKYLIPITINNDDYYEGGSETVMFDVTAGDNATAVSYTHLTLPTKA